MNLSLPLSLSLAGLIVDDDTYIADVYNFPFALGGLLCNGSEDDISQCDFHSDCAAQPPALPGSACCSRDRDNFIAMSCIRKLLIVNHNFCYLCYA